MIDFGDNRILTVHRLRSTGNRSTNPLFVIIVFATAAGASLAAVAVGWFLGTELPGCRQFGEPDQGQNCLPYMLWQPIPCCDDSLQIDAKGCQGRTIEAPVLQRICSAALRADFATTIAVSGCGGIEVGFDSHWRL
jgi:hypothetical protein